MKSNLVSFKVICLLLFHSIQSIAQENNHLPVPKIIYGNAIVCGKMDIALKDSLEIQSLDAIANHPFINNNEAMPYKININNDGTFSTEIPMICEGFIGINISYNQPFVIGVAPNQTTYVYVFLNNQHQIEIEYSSPLGSNRNEIGDAMMYCIELWNSTQNNKTYVGPFSSLDEFSEIKVNAHEQMIKQLNASELTTKGKQWATYTLNIFTMDLFFYYFNKNIIKNDSCNNSRTSNQLENRKSQHDLFLYSFLKLLNLNDPNYLYAMSYQQIMNEILDDKIFNLPNIDEHSLVAWVSTAKNTLKDVLGFDSGIFYDMLIASAYYRNIWLKHPLTEAQKKDISNYFTNRAFTKFLQVENQKCLKENEINKAKRVIVVPTPPVLKERILDAIVEKYRGKVVFIDFWATWCAPCLAAMPEEEEAKVELKGRDDVIYVYLTNNSSSYPKWKAKIQGLEGEHYRLDGQSWEYIMDQLNFSGIPSYLIYDKEGVLIHKQTMFMGKEKMIEWIKELR